MLSKEWFVDSCWINSFEDFYEEQVVLGADTVHYPDFSLRFTTSGQFFSVNNGDTVSVGNWDFFEEDRIVSTARLVPINLDHDHTFANLTSYLSTIHRLHESGLVFTEEDIYRFGDVWYYDVNKCFVHVRE